MFRIKQIDHLVLRVRDMETMVAFYRDTLGCPIEKVQEEFGLWQLRAGTGLIDLVDVDGPIGKKGGKPPGDAPNLDHLCLSIEPWEPDRIIAAMRGAGVEIEDEPGNRYGADGQGPSLYLKDPEGNTVELKGPAGGERI